MAKELLINVSEGEECRIALLADDKLQELYMERASATSHVGNIYKGKVTNVEASIQAAFVDFGLGRNGFLHISDLMPTYFGHKGEEVQETVGRKMARRDRPPIQRCLRRGDEILVQIIKEGIGTKGPTLSTYLSIPGRILVMMPGMGKMGISRKIEDETERRRLRQILDGLKPPRDVGFIIRTAGIGKTKAEIERDLKYLTRLWENIEKNRVDSPAPVELYTEGDLVTRTVRDVFSADIDRIIVDNKEVARKIKEFFKIAMPRTKNKVELHDGPVPLFHQYGIEREIEQMYSRHVPLPSGGSLVIDSTEAIVAIDVNSGKFRDHSDAETTAFKTDMEAADEIPRQLKLRDLGGVIICDFIDLRYERHRRELERKLHDNFKKDRAKTKVLRMSQFGIIEITRQRMRPSLKRSIYFDCPHCKGSGLVKTPESMSLDVMRRLAIGAHDARVARVELSVCADVSYHLQNRKRRQIAELEEASGKRIVIRIDATLGLDEVRLELFDQRDGLVFIPELGMAPGENPPRAQAGRRDQPGRQRPPRHQQPTVRQLRVEPEVAAMDERYLLHREDEEESDERPPTEAPAQARSDARPDSRSQGSRRDRFDSPDKAQRGRRDAGERRDAGGRRPPPIEPSPEDELPEEDEIGEAPGEIVDDDAGAPDEVPADEAPELTGAPEDEQAPTADADDATSTPGAEAPKRRRRGRRGGRRHRGRDKSEPNGQGAGAPAPTDSPAATPQAPPADKPVPANPQARPANPRPRGPEPAAPAASANPRPRNPARPQPIAAPPVVKTGSTDRHLINDEPVAAPSTRRPRSMRDLDSIPDDYD